MSTDEPRPTSQWHDLASTLPLAVIITDADGVVNTWTPEAERLYLWPASEAIGTPIQHLTVGPTEATMANHIMATVIRGEAWEGEFTAQRRDGSVIEVHVIDLPVTDADGHVAGIVGLSFDVSQPRAQLRAEVERLAEITSWVARSRHLDRQRIGRDLHDELGQLLTVLRTELLRTDDTPPPDADRRLANLVYLVDTCLLELRRVCHDLRTFPLDLAGLAARIDDVVRRVAQRCGLAINFVVTPELVKADPPVVVWPTVLDTAWNLIREALTNVERHANASEVTVTLHVVDDHLVGVVSDDGRGLGSNGSTAHATPGLGVAGMHERVEALHGSLRFDDASPGTTVEFRLPLVLRT